MGYHPGVEDTEIYLPGILKQLQPTLFPYNTELFASHADMTLFPNVMAASIRVAHVSVGTAMLPWHVGSKSREKASTWSVVLAEASILPDCTPTTTGMASVRMPSRRPPR